MTPRPAPAGSGEQVQAAGGVLWRRAGDDVEVALVHRPKYDDWSFPKGKLDPGETHEQAARREVHEETACRGALGAELTNTTYIDGKGRHKTVRYWAMTLDREERFEPNDEIDEVRWLRLDEAERALSYDRDHDVLESFIDSGSTGSG